MISVVLTTFNRKERLKSAVESVLGQSYEDFELIVVDDGSTDDTSAYMESLTDPRVKYIQRKKNFGTDTRPKNEGILASKGKYIALLDDDCTYRPEHLEILLKELEANPDIAMVYGDRWVTVEHDKTFTPRLGVAFEFNPYQLFQQNYIDTSDVLVRREALFAVGGFDERYRKFIDWNLWLRMVKYGYKFKRVQKIITDYNLVADSKSLRKEDSRGDLVPAWEAIEVEVELPYLGEVKEPKVAIYTLTMNRLEYTKECLETLYNTPQYPFDHYIYDNGSTDGTVEYLKSLKPHGYCKNVHVSFSPDNKGISIASNSLLDTISEHDYQIVGKVDNDAYFRTGGWLKKMVEIWQRNHRISMSCYVEGLKDNPGGAPREIYGQIADTVIGITQHVGGICHFVDSHGYSKFRWDENSPLHGMQDLEFTQYLGFNGYQHGYLENFFVEHRNGTAGQHEKYPEYFEKRKTEKTISYKEAHEKSRKH